MTQLLICSLIASAFATTACAGAPALLASGDPQMTHEQSAPPETRKQIPLIVGSGTRSPAQDDERARGLVRIGEDGIARANDAALDAYFAKDFVFHAPDGDLTYEQLKAGFAAMRAAFSDFAVTRSAIIAKGDFVAARTTMTGVFTAPFAVPPYGTLAPTGRPFTYEITNIFRYDAEGRLAEEWIQSDQIGFLRQLGLVLQPASRSPSDSSGSEPARGS